MGLTIGLVLFLVWVPPYVQSFFWISLQANALLASMTLGFGLLALSLLWSTGQQLDSWTFLFFNVRGRHPRWLDALMTGITQIGNGIAAVVLAFILFLAGYQLLAYELILGILTLWWMVELVKALARRRRPFLRITEARIVGQRAGGRSFPAGIPAKPISWRRCWSGTSTLGFGACSCSTRSHCWWASPACTWGRTTRGCAGGGHPGRPGVCWEGSSLGIVCNTIYSVRQKFKGRPMGRRFCYIEPSACADDRATPFCYAMGGRKCDLPGLRWTEVRSLKNET